MLIFKKNFKDRIRYTKTHQTAPIKKISGGGHDPQTS